MAERAPGPPDPESGPRAEIRERVARLIRARLARATFVPGESPVPCSGRVYDEADVLAAVEASLDFWLTLGPYGDRLERALADRLSVRHAILTNSGSSANLLAVSALTSPTLDRALRPGDEVITVAAGFPTTVGPIVQNGLVPVFVDVLPGTAVADPGVVEAAVGPRTRAVMMAHTLGNPFDLDAVLKFVRGRKIGDMNIGPLRMQPSCGADPPAERDPDHDRDPDVALRPVQALGGARIHAPSRQVDLCLLQGLEASAPCAVPSIEGIANVLGPACGAIEAVRLHPALCPQHARHLDLLGLPAALELLGECGTIADVDRSFGGKV
jgi:hypothetical protein